MLTAYGSILTTEFEGVIPGLLKRWYAERTELQAKKKKWSILASGIEIDQSLAKEIEKYTILDK